MEWEQLYQAEAQMSIWPWSDLVSYVMRYAHPRGGDFRVLELGCGAGANIPLFKHLGVRYHAIEGSRTVVERLVAHFPEFSSTIQVGDFTSEVPFEGEFDLVVDRGSMTCNTTSSIRRGLELVEDKLAAHGKFIGIDWYSTAHSDFTKGEEAGDDHTKTDIPDGPFKGMGTIHFSDPAHLLELFAGFEMSHLEHKCLSTEIPEDRRVIATWNFLATKKHVLR